MEGDAFRGRERGPQASAKVRHSSPHEEMDVFATEGFSVNLEDSIRSMTAMAEARSRSTGRQPIIPEDSYIAGIQSPADVAVSVPVRPMSVSADVGAAASHAAVDGPAATAATPAETPRTPKRGMAVRRGGGSPRQLGVVASADRVPGRGSRLNSESSVGPGSVEGRVPGQGPGLAQGPGEGSAGSVGLTPREPASRKEETPRTSSARSFTLHQLRGELQSTFRELGVKPSVVATEVQSEIRSACKASMELLRRDLQKYITELATELKRGREELAEEVASRCVACLTGHTVHLPVVERRRSDASETRGSVRNLSVHRAEDPSYIAVCADEGTEEWEGSNLRGTRGGRMCSIGQTVYNAKLDTTIQAHEQSGKGYSARLSSRKSTRRTVSALREEADEVLMPHQHRAVGHSHNCWPSLSEVVSSNTFGYSASFIVFLYTVVIGVETDWAARHWLKPTPRFFHVSEVTFFVIFLVEIILRIYALGTRFFTCSTWRWNVFDFVLVFIHLIEVCAMLNDDVPFLRTLKLLRSLRLIRVLHLVGELRTLTISIMNSVRSLMWSMILLVLITFIFGVMLTDIVASTRRLDIPRGDGVAEGGGKPDERRLEGMEDEAAAEVEWSSKDKLALYFGSLPSTMLLLYETVSEGVHWGEVVEPLTEHCSPWLALLFCFYMSFMLFAMLNVLTAFFVESTLRVAEEDKKRHMMSELWEAFRPGNDDEDDADHSITLGEFQRHLDNPKMKAFLNALDLDPETAMESPFFHLIDTDGSGEVDADELVSGCLRLTGGAKSFDVLSHAHDYREDAKHLKEFCIQTEISLTRMENIMHDIAARQGAVVQIEARPRDDRENRRATA